MIQTNRKGDNNEPTFTRNPKLTVTHVNEVKAGINHRCRQCSIWKSRNDYGKRCHCGKCAMAKNLLIFSDQIKMANSPVVMSADNYGKDNKPKITNMGPLWPTLEPFRHLVLHLKNHQTQDFGCQMIML